MEKMTGFIFKLLRILFQGGNRCYSWSIINTIIRQPGDQPQQQMHGLTSEGAYALLRFEAKAISGIPIVERMIVIMQVVFEES